MSLAKYIKNLMENSEYCPVLGRYILKKDHEDCECKRK
ncbi:hypothetical protein BSP36_204 [Bacillus phage BSP36]|uniref:Uncharacterized protein n=1 Tax=Bacillus phage BSP38 TaxID=2283013 RepID=A0A345MK67_BPBSP|nr:hypothetical protein HWB82_gp111 [Bacillus phage BSP38]AXH71249.1 hypothetical protein BSP38_207 [Bacillus phage BSP38]AYJ75291.1 hypothetical protein BSP36_204 [Bacillus phage BSP36]